jgi:hypothetical protein
MDNITTLETLHLVVLVMNMGNLKAGGQQVDNLARASEFLRNILNNKSSLNHWITDETRAGLQARAWWLQGTKGTFSRTCVVPHVALRYLLHLSMLLLKKKMST